MSNLIRFVLLLLSLFILQVSEAQKKPPVADSIPARDSAKEVHLIRANLLRLEKRDSTDFQILVGNAQLRQGNTFFKGDSIVMNKQKNIIEVFGNIHINDADSVNVYSQYLIYYSETKIANLKKAVKLTDGKATLTTEELQYDLNTRTGTYLNNGKIVTDKSTLTSKEGYYYADTRDAYFHQNVKLIDPDYTMVTDTLLYNVNSKIATFVSPTTINDGKSIIKTSDGFYDMNKGLANFGKRPVIRDSTQYITADSIAFDKTTGEGTARGNFVYIDSVQGVTVMAEQSLFNRDKKTFLATHKPVMIIKQDKDSLFITGDTLYSGIKVDTMYVKDTTAAQVILEKEGTKDSSYVTVADDSPENITPPAKNPLPGRTKLPPGRDLKKPQPAPLPLKDTAVKDLTVALPSIKDSTNKMMKDSTVKDSTQQNLVTLRDKDSLQITRVTKQPEDSSKTTIETKTLGRDTVREVKVLDIDRIDSVRFFHAYHHVKIFSDSMQAVCDSMFFSGIDSIFRLYNNPVVWAKESQISGDTIFLYTKNKKPTRVEVWENAFSISKSNEEYYNQLKGNVINGYFVDGEIEHIRSKGSAESLYYMQDEDSAYTGANYAQADLINLYLAKRALQKITWINDVTGGFYPVKEVPEERKKFRNFRWEEARRPKTRFELFE